MLGVREHSERPFAIADRTANLLCVHLETGAAGAISLRITWRWYSAAPSEEEKVEIQRDLIVRSTFLNQPKICAP